MKKGLPWISIIIPWCDRSELEESLLRNKLIWGQSEIEVLIVNSGGNRTVLSDILNRVPSQNISAIHLSGPTFNKSLALNIGAEAAQSTKLFFLDADIVLKENFLPDLHSLLEEGYFVTVDRVFESKASKEDFESEILHLAYFIEIQNKAERLVRVETNRINFHTNSRSAPGLIALNKHDFVEVGGMNSALENWGWEDLDLIIRLQMKLNLLWQKKGSVLHLSHSDQFRKLAGMSKQESEQHNFLHCLANYHLGHFDGSFQEDCQLPGIILT